MPLGLVGAVLVNAGPQRVPPPSERLLHRLSDGVRTEAPSGGIILERIKFATVGGLAAILAVAEARNAE